MKHVKNSKGSDTHTETYDDHFYENQVDSSYMSAKIYLRHLWKYMTPQSVLDVGCGRGSWLKACHELGSIALTGLDGSWNSQEKMIDDSIVFKPIDLNRPFDLPTRVDLAISLEVAEHLEASSAASLVDSLTRCADVVMFGAACIGQGGTSHINERPASYWAHLFLNHDYAVFDLFRPYLWDNQNIAFWYRQNTFLYVNKNSESYERFLGADVRELSNIGFMDCIHPELFRSKPIPDMGFQYFASNIIPSFFRAVKRKIHING